MAVVYEGFDTGFRPPRHVAIKLMDSTLSAGAEYRARFEREAALVAGFRHDNIVRVFSSGETRGAKYILMEYLGGGTLSQQLESGPLSVKRALQIAAKMADALAYSHERGVIHRDFKPGNILLTEDGKPVLSDFGVAKDLSADSTELTRGVVAIGAPKYMPPEQLLGERVTDRADVYSWGLTLFQMLTGGVPAGQMRVQHEPSDSGGLTAALPGVSRPVVDLICRCLQQDCFLRPSALECHEALVAELARPAAAANAPVAGTPAARLSSSTLPWAIGLTATVLVAGALYFGLFKPPVRQPTLAAGSRASSQLEAATPAPVPAALGPTQLLGTSSASSAGSTQEPGTSSTASPAAPAQGSRTSGASSELLTQGSSTSLSASPADPTSGSAVPLAAPLTVATEKSSSDRNVCGFQPSTGAVDAIVSQGLKAQVNLSFAGSEAEQNSAAGEARRVINCLAELRRRGYETLQSKRWISEMETSLTQMPGERK